LQRRRVNQAYGLHNLYIAALLIFVVVIIGVIGYMAIEGYSFVESLYMVIITIATVGFEEVRPLDGAGMYFTIFLIVISLGIFGYAITTLTRFVIEGEFNNYYFFRKMEQKISHISNHIVICGYGRNGRQVAAELSLLKQPFIIIEEDSLIIAELRKDGIELYIQGDATQDEVLERASIGTARALITTLPNDANNTFVALTARSMNSRLNIIARASDASSDVKLKRAGASNVIMPDKLGGIQMAKLVMHPDLVEFVDNILMQSNKNVTLAEIAGSGISAGFLNATIGEIEAGSGSGAMIIGLKTERGDYKYNPLPEERIGRQDKLFVLGTPEQIALMRSSLATGNS
jgi:voltage-gated potassium channel